MRSKCRQPSSTPRGPGSVEPLEGRRLLSSVVVNSTADTLFAAGSGSVSLRNAVATAAASTTATTITFDPKVFAAHRTITLGGTVLKLTGSHAVTITGPAAGVTVSGNAESTVLQVAVGVTAAASGLTVTDGKATGAGGGILDYGSLTLAGDTVSDNASTLYGAGISVQSGKLTATGCTIAGNRSPQTTGIDANASTVTLVDDTLSGNVGGGSVLEDYDSTESLTGVTVSGNTATAGAGGLRVADGGKATVVNSTFTGNRTTQDGGGIDNVGGTVSLAGVTIAGNAAANGGGIYNTATAAPVVSNSIVAGNAVAGGGAGPDVDGAISSAGHNLIGQANGGKGFATTDLTGTTAAPLAADLGSLAANGGPTQTLLPLAGSPAIDHGSNGLIPSGVTTDQRGDARVVNGTVDVGAVEVQPSGSVSGTVFADANANGKPDSGEAGLAGVTVYDDANNDGKLDDGEPSVVTSSTGAYTLAGLAVGNHKIRAITPAGYAQTVPTNDYGYTVTLAAEQKVTGDNVGERPLGGTVSGTVTGGKAGETVYLDANNDGKLDDGERSTTTSSTGAYSFAGVTAGAYVIRQVLPSGVTQKTPTDGYGIHLTVTNGSVTTGENFADV